MVSRLARLYEEIEDEIRKYTDAGVLPKDVVVDRVFAWIKQHHVESCPDSQED